MTEASAVSETSAFKQIMDSVQNNSRAYCETPSSVPFRLNSNLALKRRIYGQCALIEIRSYKGQSHDYPRFESWTSLIIAIGTLAI